MEINQKKSIIEAILFAAGRPVKKSEMVLALEITEEDIENLVQKMQEEYCEDNRGIELIKVEDSYQLCTKKELYEYIYPVLDKRNKPNLSNAALETLAIIAYNPKITRAEIEAIRGVSADACVYKLLEYGLIEEAGKIDLPGKPMSYKTTNDFLRMFGYSSLEELPELPRYKLDENKQIVIEDLIEASKASSGSLSVNLEKLEAGVFLVQTVGEFKEKTEKNKLDLQIKKPEEPIYIMADGRHFWRVIDNLMNNICKYAQPETRVYINLEQTGEKVQITFRNTSRYPLNISSEELMERFVRGDSSRNTEGNGLGLSIAGSLMELMHGKMQLFVDGDLFKVVLEFDRCEVS